MWPGCYKPEQLCDFRPDCKDDTDEKSCPPVFIFDDCDKMTGDKNCFWKEEPMDSLNWILVNDTMTGVKVVINWKVLVEYMYFRKT